MRHTGKGGDRRRHHHDGCHQQRHRSYFSFTHVILLTQIHGRRPRCAVSGSFPFSIAFFAAKEKGHPHPRKRQKTVQRLRVVPFDKPHAQRVRSGVHRNGRPDLEQRDIGHMAVFFHIRHQLVAESFRLLPVVAEADT